ncbi:tRNA dihydrouridine synthase DusB [Pokkaliibacter sp. CJK22405]|uniref:tRNA dihydrouridine synthase DusB n=1 Tax=Pokkaliibacter sp. CJK22405 TaxID=3384615 RepID=UPI0039854DB8
MFSIGSYTIDSQVILAPMAGVTDLPFRRLCKRLGAGMVVSEMLTANHQLWHSRKSQKRMIHLDEPAPRSVQIAGGDPQSMAEAARLSADQGAQIIDLNMGCPAKKVCNKAAGSALLRDEALVKSILEAVVAAVDIPVTLKIRTGWSPDQRNGVTIARMAESIGIQALAVHGRTREDRFMGNAEYDTIAEIVSAIGIPVFANGDVTSPQQAKKVLDYTGASAVMIGRAAQGNPWIFREIDHFLRHGNELPSATKEERHSVLLEHLDALYTFYGQEHGARIARKHVGWYLAAQPESKSFRKFFNQIETSDEQVVALGHFFSDSWVDHEVAA